MLRISSPAAAQSSSCAAAGVPPRYGLSLAEAGSGVFFPPALLAVLPTIIAGLTISEILKATGETLETVANFVTAALEAGAESITITVKDYLLGEKIIVQGRNTQSTFAPAFADDAGKVLVAWMLYLDNDAPVLINTIFGSYYWRRADGSIAI